MLNQADTTVLWENARAILGVSATAGAEELRAAYLQKVKEHSPDRDPEGFERIRDAYESLRDPRRRMQRVFRDDDLRAPLTDLARDSRPPRRFAGPKPWLDVLKEKRS